MTPSLKPINQQVIVITGASSGIGLATALEAAGRGAKLVLAARSSQTLDKVVSDINSAGGQAVAVTADVSNSADLERVAQVAIERFGRVDTWINNAAVGTYGRLDEISEQDSRRLFDINFWGVVNGSRIALPFLRAAGGALINVGSEVSEAVVPLQGMYSASKHAIKGFTDALRVEVEEVDHANVSVTLIQPTAVNTPWPQHAKNYLPHEPKLPSPQIDPGQVAEAILSAATSPTRYVKVGAMAKLNTMVAKLMPSLGDKMFAKQADRQHYDEPPRDPDGTLYRAGESGRTHGSGGAERAAE
jgi:short-subunit dehydrogenase